MKHSEKRPKNIVGVQIIVRAPFNGEMKECHETISLSMLRALLDDSDPLPACTGCGSEKMPLYDGGLGRELCVDCHAAEGWKKRRVVRR